MRADTIAACATPPGRSALAALRASGGECHRIAERVIADFQVEPLRTLRRSRVLAPDGAVIDDITYLTFAAPSSYTGEDMVEIFGHGGSLLPREVLSALLEAGAREAEAGEFTLRAVINGKMDLLQAEAVADLIDARAAAQRRAALSQLDKGLSVRISELRAAVLELEALITYDIDFPEEDSGPISPARVQDAIDRLRDQLEQLIATAPEGERIRDGALCVIAGVPNAGKSSLFNALLGEERAIVTEVEGTTRDAIEASVSCGGYPFRLVDTAGLRDTEDRVEKIGVEISRRYSASADLVLLCVESTRELTSEENGLIVDSPAPVIMVRTKSDLGPIDMGPGISVSVVSGAGLVELREKMAATAFESVSDYSGAPMLTRERHRLALSKALDELVQFDEARSSGLEAVVAGTHLRAAVLALEEVVGVVTGEEVLGRVFSSFCVGK